MLLLFYSIFSEAKSRSVTMRGPFVHIKPAEMAKNEDGRYQFAPKEVDRECAYLTKKHPHDVVIFKTFEITRMFSKNQIEPFFKKANLYFEEKHQRMQTNYKICTK